MVVVSNNLIQVKPSIGTNYNLSKTIMYLQNLSNMLKYTRALAPRSYHNGRWFALLSRGRMFLPS